MTPFTKVTGKHIQILQGIASYKTAIYILRGIKDSCGLEILLICHLAKYWTVPQEELISSLSPKKK
jgi:hypothetical protein